MQKLTAKDIHQKLVPHIAASKALRERAQAERQGAGVGEVAMYDFAVSAGKLNATVQEALAEISLADTTTIREGLTEFEVAELTLVLERACMGTPVPTKFYAALLMVVDAALPVADAESRAQKADRFLELGNPQRLLSQAIQGGMILIPPTTDMVKAIFDKVIVQQTATGEALRDLESRQTGGFSEDALYFGDALVARDRRVVMETLAPLIYTPIPMIKDRLVHYAAEDVFYMLYNIAGNHELSEHYHLYAALLMWANPDMTEDGAVEVIRQTPPFSLKNPHLVLEKILPNEEGAGDGVFDLGAPPSP